MAKLNRRTFLAGAAAVPMIGDVIEPWYAGIIERDGEQVIKAENTDIAYGTIMIYGRMALTGKQLAEVRDDAAWKELIDRQCENLKQSMYEYAKRTAARHSEPMKYLSPEGSLRMTPMQRKGDRYV